MSVPPIPSKFSYIPISSVDKHKTDALFAFLVRRLCFTERHQEYLNHIQMSNLVFNEPDNMLLKGLLTILIYILKGQDRKSA